MINLRLCQRTVRKKIGVLAVPGRNPAKDAASLRLRNCTMGSRNNDKKTKGKITVVRGITTEKVSRRALWCGIVKKYKDAAKKMIFLCFSEISTKNRIHWKSKRGHVANIGYPKQHYRRGIKRSFASVQ